VGRHTEPGTGAPAPDRGFWVRAGVVSVLVLLVGGYALTRDGDDDVSTANPKASTSASPSRSSETATSGSASPSVSASASPSPSATPSPSSSGRPPTLAIRVLRDSYITVRVPGGATLVSKTFRKGQQRTFDQKVLQVVNGRPSAVRFTVNGKAHKPGPADQPETFTARRR
jgi:cytoskeletal protein RodZ